MSDVPDPQNVCPQCSSGRIVSIDVADAEPEGDELSADAPAQRPDPPNMRCEDCGHRWWRAQRVPPISTRNQGIPE